MVHTLIISTTLKIKSSDESLRIKTKPPKGGQDKMKGAYIMTVTYQDELGVISVKIDKTYGVQFSGYDEVLFTDEDGKDYTVNTQHLISISAE